MNISMKREQNNACIGSAEREKFGAKLKTKNIFKTVALAMMMPAMLLTTACSSEDDVANTSNITNKGYALPVTVNVTRGDGATRATFDGSKLNFGEGDKLFVEGVHIIEAEANRFAGTLTWQSGGTFSGTIYTQNEVPGTADALFTAASASGIVKATLLPNGYESYNFLSIYNNGSDDLYDDVVAWSMQKAFVASETAKATGVEQLSFERATTYSSGFALAPANAILNFTISGLEAGAQDVTLSIDYGGLEYPVTGSVTPNASGVATFAIGVTGGSNIKVTMDNNLTVDTYNFTLPSSTTFAAGKIYNITRNALPDLLSGVFSVSSTKKVKFSKGNLRYASGTWSFFNNQYDYYTSYSADAWDHFGWSTSATTYGMNTSTDKSTYSGSFVDWGSNSDLQTALGTGWFTLSKAESTYLFNTRSASTVGGTSNGRYAKAKVNGVWGVILFPDTYTHPDGVTAPVGVNAGDATGWNGNNYTIADWTKMESAGCVFLPAAGYRDGESLVSLGIFGAYWSATSSGKASDYSAYDFVYYYSGYLEPAFTNTRNLGFCVRLVRQVTE